MTNRLRPLTGEASKLWKLLTQNDLASLRHGLELAAAAGWPLEGLLDGVGVDATGNLIRSSRFSGTAQQQPVLDVVLLHQLSMAPDGSPAALVRQSVRELVLAVPLVPLLKGFDALEHLDLSFSADDQELPSLENFGLLPSLKSLSLRATGKEVHLRSISGLQAPQLEDVKLAQLGLHDVYALVGSTCLLRVDLSFNTELGTLRGLESAAATLRELRIQGCKALYDIDALRGSGQLQTLDLEGCESLSSLEALRASNRLTQVSLKDCARLGSFEGLSASELQPFGRDGAIRRFSLTNCESLSSLQGLPRLAEEFVTLQLENLQGLKSLQGIEAARCVTKLELHKAPVADLSPVTALSGLQSVEISHLPGLTDLQAFGQLSALQALNVRDCQSLTALASEWSGPLARLNVDMCPALTSLGTLPSTLEEMSLHDTPRITTLRGLEGAKSLRELKCGDVLTDVAAIAGHPQLHVVCHLSHPQAQVDNILNAYASVPQVHLEIFSITKPDLRWLVQLQGLHKVWLDQDCAKDNGLEQQDYDSQAEVQKLQRKICRAHKLPLPSHLKPTRSSSKAQPFGLSLKELKALLTSEDPVQVTEGLTRLKDSGDPSLYDQVIDGIDPAAAYSGDSRAMGRLFREVRADGRLLARWALTTVLAQAPEAATLAVAARQRVSALSLIAEREIPNPWGSPPPPKQPAFQGLAMPALSGFTGLEELTLQGLAMTDLAWMGEVPSLRRLILKDLPCLASFRGLAGVSHIESIRIDACPVVQDPSDLRHLGQLKGSGYRKLSLRDLGPLRDLGFVSGLSSLGGIELRLAAGADLSGFANATSIGEVSVELESWSIDLKPLKHVRKLHVRQEGADESTPEHQWAYDWPVLEELYVGNGQHNFAGLRAPALERFTLYGSAKSLHGLGAFSRLGGSMSGVGSIDALVDSRVAELDLCSFNGLFDPVSRIQSLRRLAVPSKLSQEQFQALVPCKQIVTLTAHRFSGSLSFLQGWEALESLDLRDSGALSDLEVLLGLPALSQIRLKGAQMKRESWPAELQERMSYRD
jgi:hypothetical protein